jgi:hypothetical protein
MIIVVLVVEQIGINQEFLLLSSSKNCLVFSNHKKNKLKLSLDFCKALFSKTLNTLKKNQNHIKSLFLLGLKPFPRRGMQQPKRSEGP